MQAIAWLGGIAFVGSLAYLVYFYAVVLAAPSGDPATAVRHALINVGLFTAFALHHSLFARAALKQRLVQWLPAAAERTVYVWLASTLLLAVCMLWQPVPGLVYEATGMMRVALYGVQLLGGVLTLRGAGVIDPLELAGIRQATASRSRDALRVEGPFR